MTAWNIPDFNSRSPQMNADEREIRRARAGLNTDTQNLLLGARGIVLIFNRQRRANRVAHDEVVGKSSYRIRAPEARHLTLSIKSRPQKRNRARQALMCRKRHGSNRPQTSPVRDGRS